MSARMVCKVCNLNRNDKKCRRFYIDIRMCNFCYALKNRSAYGSTKDMKQYRKNYREKNKQAISEYHKLNRIRNKERILKLEKERRKKAGSRKEATARRRAMKLKATPSWCDKDLIKAIYKNCPEGFHVDHIIPLKGKNVCGLHIPENLQYLSSEENIKKSNILLDEYARGDFSKINALSK
jgi:5-methylcytosine-specific restriction endonuclease McrA